MHENYYASSLLYNLNPAFRELIICSLVLSLAKEFNTDGIIVQLLFYTLPNRFKYFGNILPNYTYLTFILQG